MKRLALFLALALPHPLQAQTTPEDNTALTLELCQKMQELGGKIMVIRQNNVHTLAEVMALYMEDKDPSSEIARMVRVLVLNAWEEPAWNSEERQQRAITDYSNDVYLACFDLYGG